MFKWGKEQGNQNIFLLPDGNGEFTRKMGMLVDKSNIGFGMRSWRYSMIVDDEKIEKYPVVFEIDELRCVVCGLCVEACPCDAIRMDTGMHMPPSYERGDFIYDREMLMSLPGADGTFETGNPRHEPGDPTHPGCDRDSH